MCEHCGCRGVEPIAELMDEHFELLELAGVLRRHVAAGDRAAAVTVLKELGLHLDRHVRREELGVFAALKSQGDFVDAVTELEQEHTSFDVQLSSLEVEADDFDVRVNRLLDDLSEHIDKENLGIFPVAVVTLGAAGWEIVTAAHAVDRASAG